MPSGDDAVKITIICLIAMRLVAMQEAPHRSLEPVDQKP
jgi:hypothetical protein